MPRQSAARIVAALLIGFLCTPLPAADTEGNYAIWGAGRASCHQYTHADETARERFRQFLMGYLTAFNAIQDDTYNATGPLTLEKVLLRLTAHCDSHPMDSYDHAIQALLASMYDTRERQPPGRSQGWGRPLPPPDPAVPASSATTTGVE